MKKLIMALFAIAMLCNACKKEQITAAPKEASRKNLVIKRVDNDGLVFNYTYDANNRLVNYTRNANAANPAQDITFTYQGNGALAETIDKGRTKTVYTYNADGTLHKKTEYDGTSTTATPINTFSYTYQAGIVTEIYVYAPTGGGWRNLHSYDMKGNLIEIKYYKTTAADQTGTFLEKATYKYDDQTNPLSVSATAFYFPYSVVNNLSTAFGNDGAVSYGYTYTYNVDGYPTQKSDGYNISTFEYKRL